MRKDTVSLEETRLENFEQPKNYVPFKERHRIFPAIFENRQHHEILDLAAGVGWVTSRVCASYPAHLTGHDISPTALRHLNQIGVPTLSFDIDNPEICFPFVSSSFDAVISLVTIEHLLFVDEFIDEIYRILCTDGFLYISTPNYAAPEYLIQPLFFGRTFHNPLNPAERYEFYAHVRYFTYRTLMELVCNHGFSLDTVYIALPAGSDRYQDLYKRSKIKALTYRYAMWLRHSLLSPDWASEPVLCFQKQNQHLNHSYRKKIV